MEVVIEKIENLVMSLKPLADEWLSIRTDIKTTYRSDVRTGFRQYTQL